MNILSYKTWLLRVVIVALVAGAALYAWRFLQPQALPNGFVASNGRIEAVEIDIAAKLPGRVKEILVDEGDTVAAGQVLAKMDTAVLEAQLREAEAQLQRARIARGEKGKQPAPQLEARMSPMFGQMC